ncbi:MAG: hypothetical protein QXW71_05720 [Thermoplasmata archaeon]
MKYYEKFSIIKNVGIELEGGISEKALDIFIEKTKRNGFYSRISVGYDYSVSVPSPVHNINWYSDVEIRFWSDDIDELLFYVETLFNLGFKQNATCGNHHHFKFTSPLAFSIMASPSFYNGFVREYKKFAEKRGEKYMRRIRNNYCKVPRDEYELRKNILGHDRYFALNFHSIFKHSTFEVRILPYAENFREFEEMHLWLCKTINKLLIKYKKVLTAEVKW